MCCPPCRAAPAGLSWWLLFALVFLLVVLAMAAAASRLAAVWAASAEPAVAGGAAAAEPDTAFEKLGAWDRAGDRASAARADQAYRLVTDFLKKRLHAAPHKKVAQIIAEARQMARDRRPPRVIVVRLRELCAPWLKRAAAPAPRNDDRARGKSGGAGRANSRLKDIQEGLDAFKQERGKVGKFLDVGCAGGDLTVPTGRALGASEIVGVDVLPAPPSGEFTYLQASADALPFADAEFDVVTYNMALHHFPDQEKALAEGFRVLAPGGLLIVREHDLKDEPFGVYLELVHYLYASVLGDEVAADEFDPAATAIAAHYRPAGEWRDMITAAGFVHDQDFLPLVPVSKSASARQMTGYERRHDRFRSFYSFFRKPA